MAHDSHNAFRRRDLLNALDELFGAIDKYRSSAGFQDLLEFLRRLPSVGPYNGLLLHIQRPGVTHVATLKGWARLGRVVRREANPLLTLRAFGPVEFVYDIADTSGPDVPLDVISPFRADGRLALEVFSRTCRRADSEGIAVREIEFGSQLAGRVSGQLKDRETVLLSKGAPAALIVELNATASLETKYATLVHELAHVYCGHLGVPGGAWWPNRPSVGYRACEFEAEAVAWIVCARQGLDPGSYRYLTGFLAPDRRVPEASLNQIMVAANHIETLGSETWRPKKLASKRPAGATLEGLLSVNTGLAFRDDDDWLAAEIIAQVEAEIALSGSAPTTMNATHAGATPELPRACSCTQCGLQIDTSFRFCTRCGHRVQGVQADLLQPGD